MMSGSTLLPDRSGDKVIAVDIVDLSARADRMDMRARKVDLELDKMGEELLGLLDRWKGDSRDRFAEYISYNVGYMAIQAYGDYLTHYAEALGKVVKIYEGLQLEIDAVVLGRPKSEGRQTYSD